MQPLQVTRVNYGDPNFKAFFDLPWKIQGNDPNWVPMLRFQQRAIFNPKKGPFFEFGEAQYFVAWRGDEAVGRLSAHVNSNYDAAQDAHTGFFGFFECRDDQEAATALLQAAAKWCKARGKTRILGPLGFGIYDEVGILIDHFESFPAMMQVHNPPYYPTLMEGAGMEKAIDWIALRGLPLEELRPKMERFVNGFAERTTLTVRKPAPSEVVKRADEVREIFNESWKHNWGHVPFTKKHFASVLSELRPMLRTKYTRAAYDADDRLAAFVITIPSLNPALKVLNGCLHPYGIWRLIKDGWLSPPKHLRTVLVGARGEHQGAGAPLALLAASYLEFLDTPSLEWWDLSLIVETNKPIIRMLRTFKAPIEQTWRIYERET